jgi:hypothetical protein
MNDITIEVLIQFSTPIILFGDEVKYMCGRHEFGIVR